MQDAGKNQLLKGIRSRGHTAFLRYCDGLRFVAWHAPLTRLSALTTSITCASTADLLFEQYGLHESTECERHTSDAVKPIYASRRCGSLYRLRILWGSGQTRRSFGSLSCLP
jgi:hypothetical protein